MSCSLRITRQCSIALVSLLGCAPCVAARSLRLTAVPPPVRAAGLSSAWADTSDEEGANDDEIRDDLTEEATQEANYDVYTPDQFHSTPGDALAAATQKVNSQIVNFRAGRDTAYHAHKGDPPPALVSGPTCAKNAEKIKAASCSLVTQISGYPEGCECRVEGETCPPAEGSLGFTGVSPSTPIHFPQMGSKTLILCMYWQWLEPPDKSAQLAERQKALKEMAVGYIKQNIAWSQAVKPYADNLWKFTPPPPGAPQPGLWAKPTWDPNPPEWVKYTTISPPVTTGPPTTTAAPTGPPTTSLSAFQIIHLRGTPPPPED